MRDNNDGFILGYVFGVTTLVLAWFIIEMALHWFTVEEVGTEVYKLVS